MARALRKNAYLFVCLLGLGLTDCSGLRVQRVMRPGEFDWTTLGGNPARTNTTTAAVTPPLVPLWEYNAQGGIASSPLVRDSVVVVTTLHGELQAVNLTTGKRIGYVVLESAVTGTPVLDGAAVIVPLSGKDESVISYDLRGGRRNWVFPAGPVESSPLLVGSSLYVTTLDGILFCIGRSDGMELWRYETGEKGVRKPIRSSPVSDGEDIFFGSDDGNLYAVERVFGKLRWKFATGSSIFASPVVSSSGVIVGNLAGVVHCFDSKSGALKWTYRTGSRVYASAAAGGSTVYVCAADGKLHAIDGTTGESKWIFSARSIFSAPPLVGGDLLYVGAQDRVLYVLKAETGEEIWRYRANGRIKVSPVLWGSTLLVTSEDKFITAFKPQSAL